MSKKDPVSLTPRETKVLRLIIKGLSNKQISEQLYSAKSTIDAYRRDLLMKTQCRNTVELGNWAYENWF